jgi:hypothetical protein
MPDATATFASIDAQGEMFQSLRRELGGGDLARVPAPTRRQLTKAGPDTARILALGPTNGGKRC